MSDLNSGRPDTTLEQAFPRIHKRALGIAVGLTLGAAFWLLTAFHVIVRPTGITLGLLANYFYGFDATWPGAFVGFIWAGACGFVAGWLFALLHNVTLDVWLLVVETRTDLSLKRHFMDHIR
jgi:hypothetical protein